SRL
ncbi:aldehyde dehydrogenase family protein, partial [Vibrio parahaemolyticus VPTS-2010]